MKSSRLLSLGEMRNTHIRLLEIMRPNWKAELSSLESEYYLLIFQSLARLLDHIQGDSSLAQHYSPWLSKIDAVNLLHSVLQLEYIRGNKIKKHSSGTLYFTDQCVMGVLDNAAPTTRPLIVDNVLQNERFTALFSMLLHPTSNIVGGIFDLFEIMDFKQSEVSAIFVMTSACIEQAVIWNDLIDEGFDFYDIIKFSTGMLTEGIAFPSEKDEPLILIDYLNSPQISLSEFKKIIQTLLLNLPY